MQTFTQKHLLPDNHGNFGDYGWRFVPPPLEPILEEITEAYNNIKNDPDFIRELAYLHKHFTGRPSPIYHLKNLSNKLGGAQIYLKREDLNHTGAHKINHCLGEALLAKNMGKKKLIAETWAWQHGVALATAAALVGLKCDIYMGEVDMEKERPNVVRMQILGARVMPVKSGLRTLKEAVDEAFGAYMQDPVNIFYAIGSVVGPHPFPMMVRDFQSIVGIEAREQMLELTGKLPDHIMACVGGGSNSIGLFTAFLDDESVKIHGIEPSGSGLWFGQHAATLTLGKPGMIHGFKCHVLTDEAWNLAPVHTIASGLDYPWVGPEHSYLHDIGRVQYETVSDDEAIEAFRMLARTEGIIPAIESAHAVAYAMRLAPTLPVDETILVNLSGRGDKDIDFVMEKYGDRFVL